MARYARLLGSAFAAFLLFSSGSAAQELTIPERIERQGEASYVAPGQIRDFYPMPLELAVRKADLIVHASLQKLRSYLSADEKTLYTEHLVLPISTIAGHLPASAATPGVTPSLVLREYGGETTIDGKYVKIYEENVPLLPTGVPMVLFLSFNTDIGKYEVVDTITGAFEVRSNGTLRHLLSRREPSYDRVAGVQLKEAIRVIREERGITSR